MFSTPEKSSQMKTPPAIEQKSRLTKKTSYDIQKKLNFESDSSINITPEKSIPMTPPSIKRKCRSDKLFVCPEKKLKFGNEETEFEYEEKESANYTTPTKQRVEQKPPTPIEFARKRRIKQESIFAKNSRKRREDIMRINNFI